MTLGGAIYCSDIIGAFKGTLVFDKKDINVSKVEFRIDNCTMLVSSYDGGEDLWDGFSLR